MMTFRFTKRQTRLTSLLVTLMILLNLVAPGYAAIGPDYLFANSGASLITGHDEIDGCQSESDGGRTGGYDSRDNSNPNFDDFDDFILSATVFLSERGESFEPTSTRIYTGRNPAPEHRPPDRG
ncbi:MAG: hypothetical protein ACRESZ_13485 [Methylococcales bacterium]